MVETATATPTAPGGFAAVTLGPADLDALAFHLNRVPGRGADIRRAVWPLVDAPLGTYRSVGEFSGDDRSLVSPLRLALRHVLIARVDRALQSLYRRHLEQSPGPGNPLAKLGGIENAARAIVGGWDWEWLAAWLGGEVRAAGLLRRLSNFAFICSRINFRMSYHCNIQCAHCYNDSGPHRKSERISLDAMLAIVAQMPAAGIGNLNLTGGEPFLYPDNLAALIAAGRKAGLHTVSIYTNAFFATTDAKADAMLGRLAAAGFGAGPGDHIKASSGPYHQAFIALDRIAILARRYHHHFGRPLVIDYECAPGQTEAEARRLAAALEPARLGVPVRIGFRSVEAAGRGRDLDVAPLAFDDHCMVIDQLSFDPDGTIRPCCGLNDRNLGIVIGDTGGTSLRALIKTMQNDAILQAIQADGLTGIAALTGHSMRPGGHTGICDLCQDVLGGTGDRAPLLDALSVRQRFYPFWFDETLAAG